MSIFRSEGSLSITYPPCLSVCPTVQPSFHPSIAQHGEITESSIAQQVESTRSSITQHGEINKSTTAEQICRV